MDDLPETVSTADLLLAVLVALFGQKTVSVKMWRGRGNTDPRVPAGYFTTDRLGKHPDAPVLHVRRAGRRDVRQCNPSR